ncbi:MAG: hypothetical protein IAE83_03910 [Anaerolinea sp.]|nr:hypothetical protein [Anaerolinea sp.]
MVDLCKEFEKQARRVWLLLKKAQSIGYQPKEETITDLNIIELRKRCSRQVITHEFTRHQEAKTGSDWEWWFTADGTRWIGFRVQAKILHLKTNQFRQLHYRDQLSTLIENAERSKPRLIPIYCFYIFEKPSGRERKPLSDSYGCSILLAHQAEADLEKRQSLKATKSSLLQPWHHLCAVCMQVLQKESGDDQQGNDTDTQSSADELSVLGNHIVDQGFLPGYVMALLPQKVTQYSSLDSQPTRVRRSSRSRPNIVTVFSQTPLK